MFRVDPGMINRQSKRVNVNIETEKRTQYQQQNGQQRNLDISPIRSILYAYAWLKKKNCINNKPERKEHVHQEPKEQRCGSRKERQK